MPMTTQYLSDRFGVLFFVVTNQAFGGFSYLSKCTFSFLVALLLLFLMLLLLFFSSSLLSWLFSI
jgi:hypothetical protein